jgi:DNA-directed RNA polymerase subunit RPC12/RpoP
MNELQIVGYSEVENKDVDLSSLVDSPEKYLIFDLSTKYICIKCQKVLSFKKSIKSVTLRCGCGCRIFYPSNSDGLKLSTYVSSVEYDKTHGDSK